MKYYGNEPFDLRLTVLRMWHNLPFIAGVTLLGTLLFGGGYYVKNVLLRGQPLYAATSIYRVDYAVEEEKDVGQIYINQVSWDTYLHSRTFLEAMQPYLNGEGGIVVNDGELAEILHAELASDLRMLSTIVTTEHPEKSTQIASAVEQALTRELAGEIREVESISILDPGDTALEIIPDVRTGRALALSTVLSCFFAVILLLLKETGDDSIWLPSSLWRRYGLKTVGTLGSKAFPENMKYFFRMEEGGEKAGSAVCPVQEQISPEEVLEEIRQVCKGTMGEDWFTVESPLKNPEVCERLRGAGRILLVVKAGSHAGKKLEYVLEYLEQQDCRVTAALLWDADERLVRRYYWGRPGACQEERQRDGRV